MEKTLLNRFQILTINGKKYRVLNFNQDTVILVQMNTSKLCVTPTNTNVLIEHMQTGKVEIKEYGSKAFDYSSLPSKSKEIFEKNLAIANDIKDIFGPTFEELIYLRKTKSIKEIANKHKVSNKLVLKIAREFLQSGMDNYSLIPTYSNSAKKRKPNITTKVGKKSTNGNNYIITPQDHVYFNQVITWYLSNPENSIKDAYVRLLRNHYRDEFIKIDSELGITCDYSNVPTINQFKNYLNKTVSQKDKTIKKVGYREYVNSHRIISGDTVTNVLGPCDLFEMDECEVDVKLVSEHDPSIVVSRPVVYIMKDAFTKMVVAYSVSFENNSLNGLTNCFANLLIDKVALCKEYGIPIPDNFKWPYKIIPNRIRVDNGAEYLSYESDRIFNELNITKQVVPPAMGSMKGNVEQFFHMMHTRQNPVFARHGLIVKDNHNRTINNPCLNIKQFEVALLCYIVEHNLKKLDSYPLSPDMIKENMPLCPTPIELWEYGVSTFGSPRPIVDEERFKYALLKEYDASITRKGILFKKLNYYSILDTNLIEKIGALVGNHRQKIKIRIDTRNISHIYRYENNTLIATPLSAGRQDSATFANWSLPEYELFLKRLSSEINEAQNSNLINQIITTSLQESIVDEASKIQVSAPSTKQLRENAAIEKNNNRKEQTLFESETINSIPSTQELTFDEDESTETFTPVKEPARKMTPAEEWAEALRKFEEETYGL